VEEGLCQVNVLEISENMPIVGTVGDLGKVGERIYAVRFQGERGFVVTFRETDPLYALDLSVPTDPQIAGELEIPGFSNYLHFINNTDLMIGVGQAAVDGISVGLQISVFDVSDLENPVRVQYYEEDSNSFSAAQYDHLAFRYLDDVGQLIVPLTVYGNYGQDNGLDGFVVYIIDVSNGISRYLTVEHGAGDFYNYGCWSTNGYLSPRSIVVNNILRTWKAHTIVATNLLTGTPTEGQSTINMDEGLPPEVCTPLYFEGIDFV